MGCCMKLCTSGDCSALLQKLSCSDRLKSNFAGIIQNPALASHFDDFLFCHFLSSNNCYCLSVRLHSSRILSRLPVLLIFITVLHFGCEALIPRQCSGRKACAACCIWLETSRDSAARNTSALGKQPECEIFGETPAADPCHAKKGFFYHLLPHQWMRDRRPFLKVIKIEEKTPSGVKDKNVMKQESLEK